MGGPGGAITVELLDKFVQLDIKLLQKGEEMSDLETPVVLGSEGARSMDGERRIQERWKVRGIGLKNGGTNVIK